MAIDPDKPHAFLSYTRADDDDFFKGGISWLREELEKLVSGYIGHPFQIFQDVEDIQPSDRWEHKLDQALRAAQLFIPILTPRFFQSDFCRREAKAFLDYEERAGRAGLILPLYFIRTPKFDNPAFREADDLAKALYERQYADWRTSAVRLQRADARSQLNEAINQLAETIAGTIERDVPVPDAAQTYERQTAPPEQETNNQPVEPDKDDADAALAEELDATKAKLAEVERARVDEVAGLAWELERARSERQENGTKALSEVEARLQDLVRERDEEVRLRLRITEEASKDLAKLEDEKAALEKLAAARPAASSKPTGLKTVHASMMGAGALLVGIFAGFLFQTGGNEPALRAELERTREDLAEAKAIIDADRISQEVAAGPSGEVSIDGVEPGEIIRDCEDACPEMVVVPAGEFVMGSPEDEVSYARIWVMGD